MSSVKLFYSMVPPYFFSTDNTTFQYHKQMNQELLEMNQAKNIKWKATGH